MVTKESLTSIIVEGDSIEVGANVRSTHDLKSFGIIVGCGFNVEQDVLVLWTHQPKRLFFDRLKVSTIMSEIVSVQPMTRPSGAVFYLDYKFERSGSK